MCCRCQTYNSEMDKGGTLSLRRQCALVPLHGSTAVVLLPRQKCHLNQLPFGWSMGMAVVDVLLWDCNPVTCERFSEKPLGKGYPILTLIVTHPTFLHAARSLEVPG